MYFWAGWGRGLGRPLSYVFLGGGYGKAHRMYFWEGLPKKEGCTACIPRSSLNATVSHVGLLACDIG